MGPLLFEPFFRPQIWGGRRLETLLGKPLPPSGQYGESWEVSVHPLHVSCVKNQELAGRNLVSLWGQSKQIIWGESPAIPDEFPWLIKFLDCNDYLSIQVHPEETIARQFFPSERGKSEVWVIVWAAPGAEVLVGLHPEITPHVLREAIKNGDPTSCLRIFSPRPGDVFYIPPGTVHSAGGGVLIAEIQTSSDATFRLYDWNRLDQHGRPRPLHIEEAFSAIRWESQPCPFFNPVPELRSPGWISQTVASTGDFHIESWQIDPTVQIEVGISKMTIAMVLAGVVTLETKNAPPLVLPKGETVLVPACVKSVRWSASDETAARVLVCSPPE